MSQFKKETKVLEKVGTTSDGAEVYHRATSGGLHQMIKVRKHGEHKILGQGNHRAVARVMANQLDKNIQWHESLFKNASEEQQTEAQILSNYNIMPESTTKVHTEQATWHTHNANKTHGMDKLYHSLAALGHFEAAGLAHSKAIEAFNATLSKLNKSDVYMDKPYNEDLLRLSYEQKNKKPFPSGN